MMNIEEIRKRHDQDMLNYQHGRQLMVVGSLVSFGLKDRGVLLECIAELEAQIESGLDLSLRSRVCPHCGKFNNPVTYGGKEVSDG